MRVPTSIEFHHKSRVMDITFDESKYSLTYEFLRVFSPSAEVRGHTPDEAKLQVGKKEVDIRDIRPVGEYALQITFSDGHNSGIYSWDWLEHLCLNQDELWSQYLHNLQEAGASRNPCDPNNRKFLEEENRPKCPSHH
ncbi:MAG: DUF971 domain-containing protein [Burkholderiaceae bacterium]|nr:DUF971 domain-containing protein [Burkholderiaceae bacterium]